MTFIRYSFYRTWAVVSTVITTGILYFLNLFPLQYTQHIFLLSLINALFSANISILLGKEKIKQYNLTTLLQDYNYACDACCNDFPFQTQRSVFLYYSTLHKLYIMFYYQPYIHCTNNKSQSR